MPDNEEFVYLAEIGNNVPDLVPPPEPLIQICLL
jgi:hypothetical protein